jgi:uncharacterized protein (TIGR03118 family)
MKAPTSSVTQHASAKLIFVATLALLVFAAPLRLNAQGFVQHNLVSDIPGLADFTDPDLKNPWGLAASATSPFWVGDNGTGHSTLYNGAGVKQGLVVTIPPPANAVTGVVFNSTASDFALPVGGKAIFLFASEGGAISGWNGGSGTTAQVVATTPGASYKGLTIGNNGVQNNIYAANFAQSRIDVFGPGFNLASPGGFSDPTLPSGYSPFNVQNIGGVLYTAYALQGAGGDDQPGPGHGFIDKFDLNGNFLGRLISGGPLNSPWAMAIAPLGFGSFAGDLLVGNFGDGRINIFDSISGAFITTLRDSNGNPIVIDGLWALLAGNTSAGTDPSSIYFTAGLNGEADGLFGRLTFSPGAVPEIGTTFLLLATAMFALLATQRVLRRKQA